MVLDEITETLVKRRAELVDMLENKQLELEKQHQVYGAINEIDLFLQTLNNYKNPINKEINLVKPPERKGLFTKLFGNVFRNK